MLRQRLMLNLGPLVLLMLLTAVGAIWLLEHVLENIRSISQAGGADNELPEAVVVALQHEMRHFQYLVLGLAMLFLVVINIAVITLLRMGRMIVQPVEKLVGHAEALGRGQFDHRIELPSRKSRSFFRRWAPGADEFGLLAEAYNDLAMQLKANEQRRLEVLGQVALAMNHELNNAMSIIELHLQLAGRQAGANPAVQHRLGEIRQSLHRMADAIQSLKHARRIVLTDYIPGTKMLDLKRSAL